MEMVRRRSRQEIMREKRDEGITNRNGKRGQKLDEIKDQSKPDDDGKKEPRQERGKKRIKKRKGESERNPNLNKRKRRRGTHLQAEAS